MDTEERRRLDRIEQAMFGPQGTNGLYGDVKRLRHEVSDGFDKLEEKQSGLYRLLAITALSVLGSGLGVVVTLLSTGGQ